MSAVRPQRHSLDQQLAAAIETLEAIGRSGIPGVLRADAIRLARKCGNLRLSIAASEVAAIECSPETRKRAKPVLRITVVSTKAG